VLDEPTTGLHASDADRLLVQLQRLVDAGNTVVMIEHDMRAVAQADWVIDVGPGAGAAGGVVAGPSAGGPNVWQQNRSVPCTGVGAGRVAQFAKCCQFRGALIVATRRWRSMPESRHPS
jgi:energy-coupling factor transporter ATP-binding protein EcfA2